ncbi:MAG: hypothetical protein HY703_03470 [Gemmatimonadetes bacterium]|nr:hypothetical protein [Gemmatimonadota bacterium]
MRPFSIRRARLWSALLLASGCQNDPGPAGADGATTARVEIVYRAATTIDPAVAQQHASCVQGVGQTHLHPSWRDYRGINMTAQGAERWSITFSDVPVNQEVRFRINDPNNCARDRTGATTENVFANGVRLTRVVDTPGSGTEPGLAFRVDAGGTVTP